MLELIEYSLERSVDRSLKALISRHYWFSLCVTIYPTTPFFFSSLLPLKCKILPWSIPASCLFLLKNPARWDLMRFSHTHTQCSAAEACVYGSWCAHVPAHMQVFMINLVRRSDRRERMLRTLYELELSCQVVAAVDGKYVTRVLLLLPSPSAWFDVRCRLMLRGWAERNNEHKSGGWDQACGDFLKEDARLWPSHWLSCHRN